MKNSWIKLYHEILSDPKMGTMSDHLYRRTIELFLLAGQEGKDGRLPDINGIAWALHTTTKDIQTVINQLEELNILENKMDIMFVKHFETRQKSELTKSESNRAYYERQKLKKSEIQSETDTEIQSEIQSVDKERDKEKNKNKNKKEIREREKEEIQTENPSPTKPPKHRYGNYKHVLLTDDELQQLQNEQVLEYIQKLDDYLENNPAKHYANHSLTIHKWIEKDMQKQQPLAKPQTVERTQSKKTYDFNDVLEWRKQKQHEEVIDL